MAEYKLNLTDDELLWLEKAVYKQHKRDSKNAARNIDKFGTLLPVAAKRLASGARVREEFKTLMDAHGWAWEDEDEDDSDPDA